MAEEGPPQVPGIHYKVSEEEAGRAIYANHVQLSMSTHELAIDFFQILVGATPEEPAEEGKSPARHVQRVTIPVTLLKGVATVIANLAVGWESAHDLKLPNTREAQPSDEVTIWE